MNERIQKKLDKMRELATAPVPKDIPDYVERRQNNDGLLKAIRTPEDAAKFMAELEALRMYAQRK